MNNANDIFEKLTCELEGRPYRPKPKTYEENVIHHFDEVIYKSTNEIKQYIENLKKRACEIHKKNIEYVNSINKDINTLYNNDKILNNKINRLQETITKLEQENKELKDKLNTLMEQLEQLNNTSNDTAPEPQQEPQQEQQTQPEPTPINNKEVDKKTSVKYKIIYLINSGKNTGKELRENIGVNINLFYECLREMLKDEVLKEHTEGRKKYYEVVNNL